MVQHATARGASLFELVLDALDAPIFLLDMDDIVFVNGAAARMLACDDPSFLRGKPISTIMHPDSVDAAAARRKLVIEERGRFHGVQLKLAAIDGVSVRCTAEVRPIEHAGQVLVLATITGSRRDR